MLKKIISPFIFCLISFYLCGLSSNNEDFFKAIENNEVLNVDNFIKNGIDINIKDKFGWTALMIATENSYFDLVKFLIDKGANANIKSIDNMTALDYAKRKGNDEIINLLTKVTIIEKEDYTIKRNKFDNKSLKYYEGLRIEQSNLAKDLKEEDKKKLVIFESPFFTGFSKIKILKKYSDFNMDKEIYLIKGWMKSHSNYINNMSGLEYFLKNDLAKIQVIEDNIKYDIIVKKEDINKIKENDKLKIYYLYLGGFINQTVFVGLYLGDN
jgi:hypothetical protein